MKGRIGIAGLLVLGLIMALGALGIGYGLWSKNLVISGTVTTGDLNADWDDVTTNDPLGTLDPGDLPPGTPAKDVGDCVVDPAGIGTQEVTVAIDNAYPSYECTVTGTITNTGDIPFNIAGALLTIDDPLALEQLGPCTLPADLQVDPTEEADISCTVHVLQEAEQETPYTFGIKACVAQWNEDATYQECVDSPQHEGPP